MMETVYRRQWAHKKHNAITFYSPEEDGYYCQFWQQGQPGFARTTDFYPTPREAEEEARERISNTAPTVFRP